MRIFFNKFWWPCILFPLMLASQGVAIELKPGCDLNVQVLSEKHFFDPNTSTFTRDETTVIAFLSPNLYLITPKKISGYAAADIYFLESEIDTDDTQRTTGVDLRNAFLTYSHKAWSIQAGLLPLQTGNGLILSNNEPSVEFTYKINSLYVIGAGACISDSSPFLSVTLGYIPGFMEKMEIFGSVLQDRNGLTSEMLENRIRDERAQSLVSLYNDLAYRVSQNQVTEDEALHTAEALDILNDVYISDTLSADNQMAWMGVAADRFIGGTYVSATAAVQLGKIDMDYRIGPYRFIYETDLAAYITDIEVSYNITRYLTISGFCFTASGDRQLRYHPIAEPKLDPLIDDLRQNVPNHAEFEAVAQKETFDATLSYLQHMDNNNYLIPGPAGGRTTLFFDNHLGMSDTDDAMIMGGVLSQGVLTPGMTVNYRPLEKIAVDIDAAVFFPQREPSGQWYGWEVNLYMAYRLKENHEIFCDGALFSFGNYFKEILPELDPIYSLSIGYQAFF